MVTKTINLTVPRGWHELDNKQLRYLFGLFADDYSSAEIRTLCLFRLARLGGTLAYDTLKLTVCHLLLNGYHDMFACKK